MRASVRWTVCGGACQPEVGEAGQVDASGRDRSLATLLSLDLSTTTHTWASPIQKLRNDSCLLLSV